MADDWFKLDDGDANFPDDPERPDFKGHDVDGYSCGKTDPNGGPPWIVRVYGDTSTLDALESDLGPGEQRFANVPDDRLNAMFDETNDAAGWNTGFKIGGPN